MSRRCGAEARGYLERRGLTEHTIRRFGFGWAPDDKLAIKTALAQFDEASAGDGIVQRDHPRLEGGQRPRDRAAEARARRVLEGFGPVELATLDSHASFGGDEPDYVVDVTGDVDALCAFSAQAVPRLRQLGWRVEVSDDYQCRVVDEPTWYADLRASDEDTNWFELELGVEPAHQLQAGRQDERRHDHSPV